MKKFFILVLTAIFINSCNNSFNLSPDDIGNKDVKPKVGADLLSIKETTDSDKNNKKVVLTVHGFTATPYENQNIIEFINAKSEEYLFSRVMLGGHGVTLEEFEKSTWKDWKKPLEDELDKLEKQGYKHVNIVATSTGGTLLMEILKNKKYKNIEKVVLIAPLIEFSDKLIQFAELLKIIGIRSLSVKLNEIGKGNWYPERPLSTLVQLKEITSLVKSYLNSGIELPENLKVLIIQSLNEKTVDPISSAIVRKGLKNGIVNTEFIDSTYHIMTVPDPKWTEKDKSNQTKVFNMIYDFLK